MTDYSRQKRYRERQKALGKELKSIQVRPEVADLIRSSSSELGISQSDLIVAAVCFWLDHLEPDEKSIH